MQVSEQRQGAVTVVKPQGPLGIDGADQFKQRLTALSGKSLGRFVIDASDLPFVDSRGLEVLLEVTDDLAKSGQALKLCAANQTVREVLNVTGLSPKFEFFEDVTAAVRSFL